MNAHKQIVEALKGSPSKATIYWDGPGAAYRIGQDSGPLEFLGWSSGPDGERLEDYFDSQCRYKGPDCFGTYPILL